MKKKIDLVDKQHNGEKWKSGSFDDESSNKEQTMKNLLSSLSKAVSKEHAFDFLYSLAASRDSLLWPLRRQLLRNKRIIPVTNITELVECVQRQFLITIM